MEITNEPRFDKVSIEVYAAHLASGNWTANGVFGSRDEACAWALGALKEQFDLEGVEFFGDAVARLKHDGLDVRIETPRYHIEKSF